MFIYCVSNPPVKDPEKGADGLKKTVVAAEEEAAVVDAYKALFIKRALVRPLLHPFLLLDLVNS